jgi:hypothetical protein
VIHQPVIGFPDFILFYLSCSQIWLNLLVADHHYWSNIRKLSKQKTLKGIGSYFDGSNIFSIRCQSAFFFASILVMEISDNHPNKDLALMATSYWKTLQQKTKKKNLAEKSDLTL